MLFLAEQSVQATFDPFLGSRDPFFGRDTLNLGGRRHENIFSRTTLILIYIYIYIFYSILFFLIITRIRHRPHRGLYTYRRTTTMSYNLGGVDLIAISTLAIKVYRAYKDAPGNYKDISEEVKALHIIIEGGVQHFERTTLSCSQRQKGKEILQGCQSVLEELDALIEEYQSLVSARRRQVFTRIKLGMEDITTLRTRLTLNTTLLNGFIQRLVSSIPF